jgi:hypothetical protein
MIVSPFNVVYDACVLYPAPLRDTLVRVAIAGLVQAKWTEQILDECFESLQRNRPDLDPQALVRTRELMNGAVRDAMVDGYEHLIGSVELPDPDDRHVVAAAIHCKAQVIVTSNLKHFPDRDLPDGIEAQSPDEFLCHLWSLDPRRTHAALAEQAAARNTTVRSVVSVLEKSGLRRFAAATRG